MRTAGEDFISQRIDWQTRYTFSAKEKDKNTGYHYFGARYYDSEVSVWLSVDPMVSGFPGISPYAYCYNNPMNYVDEWGLWGDPDDEKAQKTRQKAVEKYGEENVGDFYYNKDKERYEFRISEKGFKQNQGDEIVDGAHASAYGGEVISNRFSYFKYNAKNFANATALAWEHRLIGKDIPDVITVSLDLSSPAIRGSQMSYTINFMVRGDKGAYLTRTEMETKGFGPDWGLNLGGLWYENPSNLNKEKLKGPVRSASGGFLYGGNYMWNGGNNPGKIYQGASLGVGLTIGGSYGKGKTYLGWK